MERLLPEFATGMLLYDRFCWVNEGAIVGGSSPEHKEVERRWSSETGDNSFIRNFRNDEELNHLRQKLQNWYWFSFLPLLCFSVYISFVWTLWNAMHCNVCYRKEIYLFTCTLFCTWFWNKMAGPPKTKFTSLSKRRCRNLDCLNGISHSFRIQPVYWITFWNKMAGPPKTKFTSLSTRRCRKFWTV